MSDQTPMAITDSAGNVIDPATNTTMLTLTPGSSPAIFNVTMTLANTEYSQAIPSGTKAITVQNRGLYDTKIAWTVAQSGTNFLTIKAGFNYFEEQFNLTGKTLYAQCATAAQVLEIMCYS